MIGAGQRKLARPFLCLIAQPCPVRYQPKCATKRSKHLGTHRPTIRGNWIFLNLTWRWPKKKAGNILPGLFLGPRLYRAINLRHRHVVVLERIYQRSVSTPLCSIFRRLPR